MLGGGPMWAFVPAAGVQVNVNAMQVLGAGLVFEPSVGVVMGL